MQLQHPEIRAQLLETLDELGRPNVADVWNDQMAHGLAAGIDEVFHFLFDDHDFDEAAIGSSLRDLDEVAAVGRVKDALDEILQTNQRGDDRYFLAHPRWETVRASACTASDLLLGNR